MSKKKKKAKKVDKAELAKRMKALEEIDMSWMGPGMTVINRGVVVYLFRR